VAVNGRTGYLCRSTRYANTGQRLPPVRDTFRFNIPFTTGILIGIGETLTERVGSIFAIRRVARAYNGVQKVIVQNFRAKPDTAMVRMPDAEVC
jgi:FO synthase